MELKERINKIRREQQALKILLGVEEICPGAQSTGEYD